MDEEKEPETYQAVVNNMGVKPAGAIAATALYKSIERYQEPFPETAEQLRDISYVDDLGLTDSDMGGLVQKTQEADNPQKMLE